MNDNATLVINNDKDVSKVDIVFTIWSFAHPRTLQIFHNDNLIEEMTVPVDPIEVYLQDLSLTPGENVLCFRFPAGAEKASSVTQGGDRRHLAAALSNFQIKIFRFNTPPSIEHPLMAHFGEKIKLLGYDVFLTKLESKLYLTFYWQTLGKIRENYTVFTHLTDENSLPLTQMDKQPVEGRYPTSEWVEGEIVKDDFTIDIPPDIPDGEYRVEVGMYLLETMQRLPVTGSTEDVEAGRDYVLLDFTFRKEGDKITILPARG